MTNQAVAEVLTALADPTRRVIFERLASRPQAVGELASQLPVSRPAVSQHLKILKDVGLVSSQAVGTRRVYRVDPDGLAAVRRYFDEFWTQSLAAFAAAIQTPQDEQQPPEQKEEP